MVEPVNITRRGFLIGQSPPDCPTHHHISSAVVSVLPRRAAEVLARLPKMDGVEVHAAEGSKIVVIIEGPSAGFLGERLTEISLLDGVISANMVFEHIDCDEGSLQ